MTNLFDERATVPVATHFTCRVIGIPKPQGSTRAFVVKSKGTGKPRAVITRDSAGQRPWRDTMAFAFVEELARMEVDGAPRPLFTAAVAVEMTFILPRPKSLGKGTKPHIVKPDYDKLLRAVGDSLTESCVIADDCLIVSGSWLKRYAEIGESPGLLVIVRPAEAK